MDEDVLDVLRKLGRFVEITGRRLKNVAENRLVTLQEMEEFHEAATYSARVLESVSETILVREEDRRG